jgi:hypothetical protein
LLPLTAALEAIDMNKEEYINKFDDAVIACVEFGQQYVVEELPTKIKFDISLHQIDEKSGKIKFLNGRLFEPNELKSIDYIQARKLLWIDGKVPHWVNMAVKRIEGAFTIIGIELCHKLATTEQQNNHLKEGLRPFRIRGPQLLSGWKSIEENGKISLG